VAVGAVKWLLRQIKGIVFVLSVECAFVDMVIPSVAQSVIAVAGSRSWPAAFTMTVIGVFAAMRAAKVKIT